MTQVNKTATTIEQGIEYLIEAAKEDYKKSSLRSWGKLSDYCVNQLNKWNDLMYFKEGKKYFKIIRENSVFAFIVKEDFKHFKKGDILKAASWKAPALNSPRGNVLNGNYPIQWTGPLYLK
tara:strand:+ start:176 stop:538 length:363 start_codon:yes stop_codon:yes gene_type:complete